MDTNEGRHLPSCPCPKCRADTKDDPEAAIAEIKKILAAGGNKLSKQEVIEFINRPIDMGFPRRIESRGRGPKPKRTQYDDAFNRRRGLYQRLVRLPKLRTGTGYVDVSEIKNLAIRLLRQGIKRHSLCKQIEYCLAKDSKPCPDRSTLTRIMKRPIPAK